MRPETSLRATFLSCVAPFLASHPPAPPCTFPVLSSIQPFFLHLNLPHTSDAIHTPPFQGTVPLLPSPSGLTSPSAASSDLDTEEIEAGHDKLALPSHGEYQGGGKVGQHFQQEQSGTCTWQGKYGEAIMPLQARQGWSGRGETGWAGDGLQDGRNGLEQEHQYQQARPEGVTWQGNQYEGESAPRQGAEEGRRRREEAWPEPGCLDGGTSVEFVVHGESCMDVGAEGSKVYDSPLYPRSLFEVNARNVFIYIYMCVYICIYVCICINICACVDVYMSC